MEFPDQVLKLMTSQKLKVVSETNLYRWWDCLPELDSTETNTDNPINHTNWLATLLFFRHYFLGLVGKLIYHLGKINAFINLLAKIINDFNFNFQLIAI